MGAKADPHRRANIADALKKAKPNDMLSLEDLANIYGVTKGPFVTARKMMVGFPPPVPQGTAFIYNAKRALKAMLDYVTRHDAATEAVEKRKNALLAGTSARRDAAAMNESIPVRDLAVLSRLAAETEERERQQGAYIPAAEVARVAGDVFGELSEFMADLSNKVDPNGLLAPDLRELIDRQGAIALSGFHKRMKTILTADALAGSNRSTDARGREPRARRKRG